MQTVHLPPAGRGGLEAFRRVGKSFGRAHFGPDDRVGADQHALAALNADIRVPDRYFQGDVALLPLGGGAGPGAVAGQGGNRQQIAVAFDNRRGDSLDEIGRSAGDRGQHLHPALGLGGDFNPVQMGHSRVHRLEVALDNRLAPFAVAFADGLFDAGDGLVLGQHAADGEEARLHNRIDAHAQIQLRSQGVGVDVVELQLLALDLLLDHPGQLLPDLLRRVGRVEQNRRALFGQGQHVVAAQEAELMDGHKVGLTDEVGALDGFRPKAQMGNSARPGLLGVVDEVALGKVVGLLADDFDGVLVGADSAVGAETPEDRPHYTVRLDVEVGVEVQTGVGDVVHNADGEVVLGAIFSCFIENRLHHRRCKLFR